LPITWQDFFSWLTVCEWCYTLLLNRLMVTWSKGSEQHSPVYGIVSSLSFNACLTGGKWNYFKISSLITFHWKNNRQWAALISYSWEMSSSCLQKVGENDITNIIFNSHLTWSNQQQKVGDFTILPVQQLIIQWTTASQWHFHPLTQYPSYLIPWKQAVRNSITFLHACLMVLIITNRMWVWMAISWHVSLSETNTQGVSDFACSCQQPEPSHLIPSSTGSEWHWLPFGAENSLYSNALQRVSECVLSSSTNLTIAKW